MLSFLTINVVKSQEVPLSRTLDDTTLSMASPISMSPTIEGVSLEYLVFVVPVEGIYTLNNLYWSNLYWGKVTVVSVRGRTS